MPESLDNRKRKILQAIVEEYIDTSEPVSSGSLVRNEELNCSSATIRNEMAELERIGFLEQPHTSAGRIPSDPAARRQNNTIRSVCGCSQRRHDR